MEPKASKLRRKGPDAAGVLRLEGRLTAFTAPSGLLKPRAFPTGRVKEVDLSGLTHLDLNGAAWLYAFRAALAARGAARAASRKARPAGPPAGPRLTGLPEALIPVWKLAEDTFASSPAAAAPRETGWVERLGEGVAGAGADLRDLASFLGETIVCAAGALARPWTARWGQVSFQAEKSVVNALPVTALVAFLVGLILAFQAAMQMQMFGVDIFVADLVGISVIRELGTLLTAIVLAGRSGSAFSSELASMKTNQEIDAILTMGLSPARDLALPRILALTLTAPLLTVLADFAGLLGGNVVMMTMGYPFMIFWDELSHHLDVSDIATGLFKSVVFGFTVALIGCQRGLYAGDSPSAVGEATTSGVVTNIIAIAVLDSLFAVLFYALSW
ncbi:MAG: ABC transporter permease [Deltaproteobacteria bacterium]|nr:ABC transporter permease [Deltaproteobacteria bacterium]